MNIPETAYRELGRTGIRVSPFCLGCWELGGGDLFPDMTDEKALEIVRTAIDMGVNFFDTAEGYGDGHSEEVLGEAVRQSGADVVIATKIALHRGGRTPKDVASAVEASLRRLQRDVIDLYQIHWPTRQVDMKAFAEEMMKLKEQGKIRAIGVSNFFTDEIKLVQQAGEIAALQSPYSVLWRCLEDDVFAYCLDERISGLVYSPLAHGMLTDAFVKSDREARTATQAWLIFFKEPDFHAKASPVLDAVDAVSRHHGCAVSQVALAWLFSRPFVTSAILGIETTEQLRENVQALSVQLDPDEIGELERAGEPLKQALVPKTKKSMTGWWPDRKLEEHS